MDYAAFVGLWLNVGRVRLQWAVAVAMGVGFALGGGDLGREVFEAIALLAEQADELEFQTNARRQEAEILARFGVG